MSDNINNTIGFLVYGLPLLSTFNTPSIATIPKPFSVSKCPIDPLPGNPFIDIQLSLHGEASIVQYKVDPSFTGKGPYKFQLLAFLDENFNQFLYTIPSTEYFIVDDSRVRQNQLASFLYKLALTTADNKVYLSQFFGWHPSDHTNRHKYLLANDIARRERVRFNYAGHWAFLLKRKVYGCIDDADVDPITGEPLVDNTATFGVGKVGGYYSPIITRFSIQDRQTKTEFSKDGRGSQFTELLNIRAAGFPFIDQHDIIVMADGKRYTVSDANTKYFPGTTMIILQNPVLRLIPNTDTVYNIEIPSFPYER